MAALPIEPLLPALRTALRTATGAVLQAPPGAGKTTRVPLALLREPWLAEQRVVMLEPRRLAARAAAHRMATLLGERVGQTVGYRVRLDTRVGPHTRIEVVTEGVLTRMLQADPGLDGIGLVVFDEYHERSLQADLGLALCLEVQEALRPGLRLLVMSATLEGGPVAALLGDVPVLTSEGRSYPVETHYLAPRPEASLVGTVAAAVRRALRREEGDVLVFLPGAGEIRRVEERLRREALVEGVHLVPLYGNLPLAEQDRAIAPSPPGTRKVVLATSIAETSLTIEGIRVVVDGGWQRVPRFAPQRGMTQLATVRVSRASAEQRRGRAGRQGPGVCYRLWSKHAQQHLQPFSTPEIREADLAPLALELALWGVSSPDALRWLDPPPSAAYAQACDLLAELGALDADGRITAHGRRMAPLPLHPRLAHLVLCGIELGLGSLACDVAALLSERDLFRSKDALPDVDLRLRLDVLRGTRAAQGSYTVGRGTLHRVRAVARHWKRQLGLPEHDGDPEACGLLLAFAYPDRIAQLRPGQPGRFRLRNGRAAVLPRPQLLSEAPFLVAAYLDGRPRESRIFLAAPVARQDLYVHFAEHIRTEEVVAWDGAAGLVRARRQERLGALVLKDGPLAEPDPAALAAALLEGVAQEGLSLLPWTKAARRLQQRLAFLHHHDPDAWPDASDDALLADLSGWLGPYVYGLKRADALQRLDLADVFLGRLSWVQRAALDVRAPAHLEVPSGSRIPIDYSDPGAPVLAVRLQEVFGLTETPRIDEGRVPLTLHLLSPAHRPVQVTQDLASFWRDAYFDVKKDLKGRYPKHYWPDDPLQAQPTRRTRPG